MLYDLCVTSKEWCKRYGLEVKKLPCPRCGKEIVADIPFAISGYRGLTSRSHGCGPKGHIYVMAPAGKTLKEWSGILTGKE